MSVAFRNLGKGQSGMAVCMTLRSTATALQKNRYLINDTLFLKCNVVKERYSGPGVLSFLIVITAREPFISFPLLKAGELFHNRPSTNQMA